MTYVPRVPLWCWALQGAEAVFFSQRTHAELALPVPPGPDGMFRIGEVETRWFDTRTCVARCQYETIFIMDDAAEARGEHARSRMPPIQCGHVARLDPTGRFLCGFHYDKAWRCGLCQEPRPAAGPVGFTDEGWGLCSVACVQASEALDRGE